MDMMSLILMAWVLDSAPFAGERPSVQTSPATTADKPSAEKKPSGVEGCATEDGCQPFFEIRIPPGTDPMKFSPRLLVKLTISPEGKVERVILKKSTGSEQVDKQVLKGIGQWRFKEDKSTREVSVAVLIHLR